MTVQWTLIASFLYLELAFTFFLLLPFISPKMWQSVCSSRMFKSVSTKANTYFSVLMLVLVLFFLDSLREMWKYSERDHLSLDATLQLNMKLFRSQRNYFISGFSVFLSLVIRRLLGLLVSEAGLLCQGEAAMRRAHRATEGLQKLAGESDQDGPTPVRGEKVHEDIEDLRGSLLSAKFDLECTKRALLDVEEQSRRTSRELEALSQKHKSLLMVYAAVKDRRTGHAANHE